ncbi:MAG: hypothetical protein ACJ76H_02760 [Bacteriovoracaceae bacterium]
MKYVLLFLLTIVHVRAQTLTGLDQIQGASPEVKCDKHLMTPQEATVELNGTKTFVGREHLPGNEQNYTCIYKTSRAWILYNNCMASKKENGATDIEVIPFEGGIVRFYIENNKTGLPSAVKRSDYDMTWTVTYVPTASASSGMNIAALKTFKSENITPSGSCYIGSTFKARELSQSATCYKVSDGDSANWESSATSFWRDPGENWYRALKDMRTTISKTSF